MSRFDPDLSHPDDAAERDSLEEAWRFQEDMEPAPMTQSPSPIVDEAAELRRRLANLDVGTGADNLAIALASYFDDGTGYGSKHPAWPDVSINGAERVLDAIHVLYTAALVSSPKEAKAEHVGAEVVAWRYRFNGDPEWYYEDDEANLSLLHAQCGINSEPLFASPQPSSVGGEGSK